MNGKIKFTDLWLQKLSRPLGKEVHYGDAACTGLSLKHTDKGVKSFSYTFRLGSKMGRVTLGRYPDVSIRFAREKTEDLRRIVASGIDPRTQKKDRLERSELTVSIMIDRFIEQYAKPKNKSWKQAQYNLITYLVPVLGSYPIGDVTRRDINSILDDLMEQGKGHTANRTLAHVRKFFGWLTERDLLENSPVAHIKRRYREAQRDRELSSEELRAIWHASEALSASYRAWLRLSLLCGQREMETARMRRSQIKEGVWHLSSSDTKNKRLHLVPLSTQAQSIVDNLMECEGDCLLVSGRIGDQPINGFSKLKARLDELSGVEGWKLHDLRASMATNLGKLGYDRFMIMRVLNHKDGGVTAGYDRYSYLNEKKEALQRWADRLDEIIEV